MSTADVKINAGFNSAAGTFAVPEPSCQASDLKRIMTDLANQIADADRRHSEALDLVQQRLGVLGHTTHGLREQLPREQTSVLDRIEGSMAELSNRIADTGAQLRNHTSDAPATSPPGAGPDAAPALRSALPAGALDAFARSSGSPSGSRKAVVVDNFDMLDSSPDADHDPIDRESADALARLYETGTDDAGVPALDAVTAAANQLGDTSAIAFSPTSPAPAVEKAAGPAEAVAPLPKSIEDDRTWLTERFADVASKLEHSLSGARGHDTLDAFQERFATLEQRLTQVVSQASSGADLSSLKSIESHVEDLNAQLVAVQTHFSRLDTIELELRSLAERLSTDELSKLIQINAPKASDRDLLADSVASGMAQQLPRIEQTLQSIATQLSADKIAGLVAQARQPAPDMGAIARMVANEISHLMPAQAAQHADPSDRLDDLKATLDAFVAERRHGDEQTNTMLDTMQQAMIRLLDRMDAIEQSRDLMADDEPLDDGHQARRQPYEDSYTPVQQPRALPTLEEATAPEPQRLPERREPEPRSAAAPAPIGAGGPRPGVQQMPAAEPALAAAPAATAPAGDAGDNRESFIAAARRAARMATEAPPEQEVAADPAAAPAKTRSRAKPALGNYQLSPVSMALICLILVGASFIAVKLTILAPKDPQPAVQSTAPQQTLSPSAGDKRLQNLEDADGNNQGPQRRSSIQNGDDRDLTGQPSNGGALPQLQALPTVPAALTKDAATENLTPRSNELPPLSIGPNSLRTAAAKGEASAEFEIGARFAEGRGVPQDLQQAVTWYQRAAAQGFAPAQYRLGSMFERGLGVKTDLAKARVWYQRAAEQGIVKAMHNLAVLTAGRDAAMTDYATAGKWFRAASDYGLTDSQFNLAIMHDSGLGMERDAKQAFKWFSLAARAGDEEAARRRESLRQKLQPQDVTEIEAELANWRPKSADQAVNDPRLAGEAWKKSTR